MGKFIDMTGKTCGEWLVLEKGTKPYYWKCRCSCGTEKEISGAELRRNRTQSCGCKVKKDLTGNRFGFLTVIKMLPNSKCLCKCDCGNIKIFYRGHLTSGVTTSCGVGHYIKPELDISGKKFGMLTAIERDKTKKDKCIYWIFKCDCGNQKSIMKSHVTQGKIRTCGCTQFSAGELLIKELLTKHQISFSTQYKVKINKQNYYFDFAINMDNQPMYFIEYDGVQHFKENSNFGKFDALKEIQRRDELKNDYCTKNNIPLIRIPYTHFRKITYEDLKIDTTNFLYKGGD